MLRTPRARTARKRTVRSATFGAIERRASSAGLLARNRAAQPIEREGFSSPGRPDVEHEQPARQWLDLVGRAGSIERLQIGLNGAALLDQHEQLPGVSLRVDPL